MATNVYINSDNLIKKRRHSGTCVISQPPELNIYRRLAGHCERISDLDFNSDSTQLVTASFDGTAQAEFKTFYRMFWPKFWFLDKISIIDQSSEFWTQFPLLLKL